jgi:hypothetical protein
MALGWLLWGEILTPTTPSFFSFSFGALLDFNELKNVGRCLRPIIVSTEQFVIKISHFYLIVH